MLGYFKIAAFMFLAPFLALFCHFLIFISKTADSAWITYISHEQSKISLFIIISKNNIN